jgi:hypothetical protein
MESKIKSFEDVQTQKAVFGGVSATDSTRSYALMHKRTSGAQFDVVAGYSGTAALALALERGEIDGVCGWDWSSFKSQKADWIRDKKANVLLQVALEPNEELTRMGVPHIWKYVQREEDRKVVEMVISQQVFQRSYIAPPGTPAEPLNILRTAFDATMADPRFRADADKLRIDIAPLPGAKVQELVLKLHATPREIIERAQKAIAL